MRLCFIGIIAKVSNSMDTLEDLNATIRGKEDRVGLVVKIDKMAEVINGMMTDIDSLKDYRKWIVRLMIGWVIMTLQGIFGIMMTK